MITFYNHFIVHVTIIRVSESSIIRVQKSLLVQKNFNAVNAQEESCIGKSSKKCSSWKKNVREEKVVKKNVVECKEAEKYILNLYIFMQFANGREPFRFWKQCPVGRGIHFRFEKNRGEKYGWRQYYWRKRRTIMR